MRAEELGRVVVCSSMLDRVSRFAAKIREALMNEPETRMKDEGLVYMREKERERKAQDKGNEFSKKR